ncbi:bacteriochlorophyll 4-vinyl reductase [Pelodictyon luteolum]|uniref:Bacteriochlorophyll 4-vinyl reductase n=1 Tax=Chlorobium luteolum (strain DSM 273 / BCRC 81028 / 2530) TaxID=319225 RepID=Q3B6C5_CHLL3|nr:bacteriochlorophyll 4-vinyl reductase [Pelodictyon luteolum]ABB23106.1 Bacteriochlorophyll 4-vinyl reductase [Pelodictyon luteolum DSM 273]
MSTSFRIGPNSIIQTVAALEASFGKAQAEELLKKIGHSHLIGNLPSEMVEESKFHALVTALDTEIGSQKTGAILEESGSRTAQYLLRVRIPGLFQKFLKLLPARPAFNLFLFAISKNAWTFAGSGDFSYTNAKKPTITVVVTHPSVPVVGSFYLGTFTYLLEQLVNPAVKIRADVRQEGESITCRYTCSI